MSGLSKPTVSLALANVERAGLVRIAGQRTGVPGRTAQLYEVRPEAGFVLGLDIGLKYLRGAVADLAGEVRTRNSRKVVATSVRGRLAELVELADDLCARAGTARQAVTQTVIGTPGVYDPKRNAIALTGGLAGWDRPAALAGLREAFGSSVALENDVDAAALAERTHGYGRDRESFAFVHVGTGIGMGLVLGGRLHPACTVAGEIAFMPLSDEESSEAEGAGGRLRPPRPRPGIRPRRPRAPGCAGRCRHSAASVAAAARGAASARSRWSRRRPGWSLRAVCCVHHRRCRPGADRARRRGSSAGSAGLRRGGHRGAESR